MTLQAQRADVRKIAFAAALGHWQNVVGIPQAPASSRPDAPFGAGPCAGDTAHPFQMTPGGEAIHPADGAYAVVALQDSLPQVAGIGSDLPFLDAPFGAKREAAFWNFEIAVAAEIAAVCALG